MTDKMRARIANKRACEKDNAVWMHEEIEALLDSIEKMDELHSRTIEAILLALGDAGATEPADDPETWRLVPIAERVKRVVEERDRLREDLASCLSDDEGWAEKWKALALKRQEERDEARAELDRWRSIPTMEVPNTLQGDADTPLCIAFRLRWQSEELKLQADQLDAIREVLDNAPTPSTNNDRTPSTLAERVEWLVWAWRTADDSHAVDQLHKLERAYEALLASKGDASE